jgi:hypothetical protein
MAKLHHCSNGTPVTDMVLEYQRHRKGDDYLLVYRYYDNFKDKWYSELQDYLDRCRCFKELEIQRQNFCFSSKEATLCSVPSLWTTCP